PDVTSPRPSRMKYIDSTVRCSWTGVLPAGRMSTTVTRNFRDPTLSGVMTWYERLLSPFKALGSLRCTTFIGPPASARNGGHLEFPHRLRAQGFNALREVRCAMVRVE